MALVVFSVTLVGGLAIENYISEVDLVDDLAWNGQVTDNNRYVFYPRHLPQDCDDKIESLEAGKFILDSAHGEMVGLTPEWEHADKTSGYANFNLHSLRFVTCLVRAGGEGNRGRMDQASAVLRSWSEYNLDKEQAAQWAWSEHAASWRAIVFSYFVMEAKKVNYLSDEDAVFYENVIQEHVNFVRRPSIYRPNHNHGLNNALALLALAMVIDNTLQQRELLALGFSRAEQQMRDNVSSDGVHLEQSGFYQFYTLRSFLEILRVARNIGWPVSALYQNRLANMIEVAMSMAGGDRIVDGLPYSMWQQDVVSMIDVYQGLIRDGRLLGDDDQEILKTSRGRLNVFDEGGYSFFSSAGDTDLEIVFHTRILDAPHAHRDALGVTVRNSSGVLIPFTSTMYTSENYPEWNEYFLGADSHNVVAAEGLEQIPLGRRRDGLLAVILDSWKLNRALEWMGLADWMVEFRRRHGLDQRSLRERSVPDGGEVLGHGSNGMVDFVTARHATYPGVQQARTVAKIDSHLMLVWDRVRGNIDRKFRQQFHFMPGATVMVDGNSVLIRKDGQLIARAQQLMPADTDVCMGKQSPGTCGWYTDTPAFPKPAPAIRYSASGNTVEFLWIFSLGTKPLKVSPKEAGEGGRKWYLATVGEKKYRIGLDDGKVVANVVD